MFVSTSNLHSEILPNVYGRKYIKIAISHQNLKKVYNINIAPKHKSTIHFLNIYIVHIILIALCILSQLKF
jgi:hypothetical protein